MKRAFFFLLIVIALPVLADDKQAAEPAALVQARKAFEAKVKEVVDPIKAAYLKKLESMKKEFGGKGDVTSAVAVQKEIDSLTEKKLDGLTRKKLDPLVGKWDWLAGNVAQFFEDGTVKSTIDRGKWKCVDKKAGNYLVVWGGTTDALVMSEDGLSLTVLDYKSSRRKLVAKRMEE
jgi:hypothetical protein